MAKSQYYCKEFDHARVSAQRLCDAFMNGDLTIADLEVEIAAEMRQYAEELPQSEG
jgi:hypothetical protein